MEKAKRIRAANFTPEEIRLLIRLALKEKSILENKKTDSEVWKMKGTTWRKIAEIFNASSGKVFRTAETLRLKYDGLKKELKKKVIKNKAEAMKTGGGKPEYINIDGPEKELLEVLSLSVHGLPSICDSDSVLPQTNVTGETNAEELFQAALDISEKEIEIYNLPMVLEETDENCLIEGSCNNAIPESGPSQSILGNTEDKNSKKNANASRAWKDWSPAALKSKRHPLLTQRRKKGEDLNKAIEDVLKLREELIKQQIHHTEQEEKRVQEKHEREMKLLEIEIKIKEKSL